MAIYDNRLEISSPGGLMPGVTIEKMKEGFSKVRNHGIANAFVYMNLIEQWGSGIPKILTQTKEYGLPEVELIDMEKALRVNMYRAFSNDEKQTRTRVILASMAKRNMIVAEGANRNRIYRLPQTINGYIILLSQTILMVALWLQKVIKSKKNRWNKRKTTTTYSYKRKSISQ